ncbi:MAG: hypothetical protein H7A49_09915 [Akkermansiaceae bacterium]|nr:hypothetical protein [Akkermansiaceae bacterium]
MNPSPESRPETHVAGFAEILSPSDGSEPPVIVGGHSVNLWAMYFLSGGADELADYQPFTSKDLDVTGPVRLLESAVCGAWRPCLESDRTQGLRNLPA